MDFIPDYQTVTSAIETAFKWVFPEFPAVGLPVVGLTLILFVYYLIKTDFRQAFKISMSSFVVMLFILFLLHSLNKLFFAVI